MLTPDQITALGDAARTITDPITGYLLQDIARRVAEAGQLTSTAQYQVWRLQTLGLSQKEIEKKLRQLLQLSRQEVRRILYQSAQSGYDLDVRRFPTAAAIPFAENLVLQQIVAAAVELAQADFTNLTQTLGMVDPSGNALPLQKAYRSCTDFAFKQVVTGAASYTEAIRQATRNLAEKGVRVIDYESGVHTSLEAAVRRNILGGLGLMQEQVSQATHDQLGCNGWEITAHANSAPDHEPIQGKQYPDRAYEALNSSLRRRIGTLNCGHAAFPIILGVSQPQYSQRELEKFRTDNEKGVTVEGRHYTGYEAAQMQRKLERAIRTQKRRVMMDEAAGDTEKLAQDRTRLNVLHQRYREFSKSAGLRTQYERTEAAGVGERSLDKQAKSGIIDPNRSKEIPEVGKASAPRKPAAMKDVTTEYLSSATPNSHTVQDLHSYVVDGVSYTVDGHNVVLDYSPHEKEIAELLEQELGGEIFMVPRINSPQGVSTPDYLFRGKGYDLKTIGQDAGPKTILNRIKKAKRQAHNFIIDVTAAKQLSDELIDKQIKRVFQEKETQFVDEIVIIRNDQIVKIIKRA